MDAQHRVSVIIPAYQAGATIGRCLDALAKQTFPQTRYEVIVVDDGSTDETRTRIEAHDGVRLLTQDHAGPATARNIGAQHAHGEILLFTDADCEPAPDWIEQMVTPWFGVATRRTSHAVGAKGTYLTRQREIVARFVQIEYEDKYDRMALDTYIDFVDTYAAGYRRDVFLANGGFDPRFPVASVEDQEFSFRLAKQGYKMVFVPEAHVYHWGHARDIVSYWRKKFKIGYWKVLVQKMHPDKLWRDSHTPQVLKMQMLLVVLGGVALAAGFLWSPFWWLASIVGLFFLLSTLPFAIKAWGKDRPVSIFSPGLLLIRALALGMGFAVGLVLNHVSTTPRGELEHV
jgi:glycosyltransferase involved in cell wall biosynthesis